MTKYYLLRSFHTQKDGILGETALHVAGEMTGNPNFKTPTITPADLTTAANAFIVAVGVCVDGTTQDTLHKNALKAALIAMLDTLADYVEANSNNNPEVMASSGFTLADTGKTTPAPVGTVTINSVTNSAAGCLNLDLACGPNVWGFEEQVSSAPNVWVAAGYFTDPRNVTPSKLTAGTMYGIRVCVHGSLNQVSDWSDLVNHMAM
jgi:hypothetical protein